MLKLVMRRKKSRSWLTSASRANSASEPQTTGSHTGPPWSDFTRLPTTRQLRPTKLRSSFTHLRWMFSRGAITTMRACGSK